MIDAQADATQPYIPEADPYYRWGRFIPITIPMFALAAVGALFAPAHPGVEPYLSIWLIATLTLFIYLQIKMDKLRNQPGYREVKIRVFFSYHATRYVPVDERALRMRDSASMRCLNICNWLSGYTLTQLLTAYFSPYNPGSSSLSSPYKLAAICLILATLYTCIFTIILRLGASHPVKMITPRAAFYWLLLSFLALGGSVVYMVVQVPTFLFPGPPASWSTLLRFAQDQANRQNRAVALESITARVPYDEDPSYSPHSTLFKVDFIFIGLAGRSMEISVLDSDPPRLLELRDPWDFTDPAPTEAVLADFKQKLATVTLGPRDVYRLTESEGLTFGREKGSNVSPNVSMYLRHDWQTGFGVPVGWNIEYQTNIPGSYDSLNLRVDGATGKIVAREHWPQDFDKPPTPVPATGPSTIP